MRRNKLLLPLTVFVIATQSLFSAYASNETLKSSHYSSANQFMMNVSRAYSLLEEKYSGDYRWGNSEAIFAQLHCHALFAPNKSRWNLDMWRTETDLDKLVKYKCNSPY